MLDVPFRPAVSAVDWESLAPKAVPPGGEEEFLSQAASLSVSQTRRSHRRLAIRGRAGVVRGPLSYGVYTIDMSAKGIGLYCPVQLFPLERVQVFWEGFDPHEVLIRRCRRESRGRYACGGEFVDGPLSATECRDLFRELARQAAE